MAHINARLYVVLAMVTVIVPWRLGRVAGNDTCQTGPGLFDYGPHRDNLEAEVLAMELTGELRAPDEPYERILRDLALIRQRYPFLESEIHGLPWMPGQLFVRLEPAGTWPEYEALNAYYQVIEDQGGLIVTDSLCFGSRSFWHDVEPADDLLLALAESYLRRPACANMTDQVAHRFEFIKQMVRDFNVDGVVFQRIRYCDLWGGQLLYITEKLKESGIPLLSLEREYQLSATGQLRTRVQAFLESME